MDCDYKKYFKFNIFVCLFVLLKFFKCFQKCCKEYSLKDQNCLEVMLNYVQYLVCS